MTAPKMETAHDFLGVELSGTLAGRFEIRQRLGSGGMGEVYLAEDTRLKRQVAIKRLAARLRTDRLSREYFLKEAERISALNNEHIAGIHDVLEDRGEIFLIMEYVEGANLRFRFNPRPSVEQFLEVAVQCAEALAAAHEKGILHRDIKPENIMLTPAGQVKILDFGLAQRVRMVGEGVPTASLAAPGHPLSGTRGYVAPEVLLEKEPDTRADIFSLGVVFYELLTGNNPCAAATWVGSIELTLHAKPSSIHQANPQVPDEVERVIRKMLEKDPDDRYATARDLLVDLRRLHRLSESGVLPPPRHLVLRRHKKLTFWGGIAATLAVIAIFVPWRTLARQLQQKISPPQNVPVAIPNQKLVAVLPFRTIEASPEVKTFSEGLAETVTAKLTQLTATHALQVAPASEVYGRGIADVDQARKELGVNLVVQGSLHQSGDTVRITYTLVDALSHRQLRGDSVTASSSDPFALEDRVVEGVLWMLELEITPDERPQLEKHGTTVAGAYDLYIRARGDLQNYTDPAAVESAIENFSRAISLDPNYAYAYAGLGEAYWDKYRIDKAAKYIPKAREACQHSLALSTDLAAGHVCLGNLLVTAGKYEDAGAEFSRALAAEPTDDDAYRGLASAYEQMGRLQDAEQTYQRAIELRPHYWAGYRWLGHFYAQHGRYQEAVEQFDRAAAVSPDNSSIYYNLGGLYIFMGRYNDAIHALQRAIALRPGFEAYANLGQAYMRLRRFDDAIGSYQQALTLNVRDFRSTGYLADAYYWAPGKRDQAAPLYERAITMADEELKLNSKDIDVHLLLAEYHARLGHADAARMHMRQALKFHPDEPETMFFAALVENQLGNKAGAIQWLGKALHQGYSLAEINAAVDFDNLRSDPAFQAIVQTAGQKG
ncbi:MAG TPA: tetratricopeptide repeat protein [Terriglobales bacterium]|jgi:serine/threonine protein kinase/tetratricopeptide (TPR) repeat protein|nr:tetratricopeptide repeat protein [Terriglobales bacterium]